MLIEFAPMVFQHLQHVDLPHYNEQRWRKIKDLYAELDGLQTANSLVKLLERIFAESGNNVEQLTEHSMSLNSGAEGLSCDFEGLQIFLEELTVEEGKKKFFNVILPFIVFLASSIDQFSPKEGIPLSEQQRESVFVADKRFIACVLASAFLCAVPPPPVDAQVRSINFNNFFACFHRVEIQKAQAAKLQCIIHYFERLSIDWPNVHGRVCYRRQVLPRSSLPTLKEWMSCDLPLCPIIVDNKTAIEDSGEHILQVDFANRFIGGGVLGGGHVQEEIRFCINPELLVAIMFMEALQENECIVARGIERFSSYAGYGKTFEFTGDFKDRSQRDENGDFLTTVVAIDAKQFKSSFIEAQYEESAVVRELNKAFVGFCNPEVGSHMISNLSGAESNCTSVDKNDMTRAKEGSLISPLAKEMVLEFSNDLVNHALTEALTDIDANSHDAISEDHEDADDVLTPIMKKSLIGVFGRSSEKNREYSENLLFPKSLPKCLERTLSGTNTPVIPSTPPSSPAIWADIKQKSLDISGFHCFLSKPGSSLEKSFADLLFNSLNSCVEFTSSLTVSIATSAKSPVLAAAETKETFQKSPRDLGSPVKNGLSILSFMNRSVSDLDSPLSSNCSNGVNISEFVEALSLSVSPSKLLRGQKCNTRQNLLKEFDQTKHEEKDKLKLNVFREANLSDEEVFEGFAETLSRLILESAILSSVVVSKKEQRNLYVEYDEPSESTASQIALHGGETNQDAVASDKVEEVEKIHHLKEILEGHVDAVIKKIIVSSSTEAAERCDGKRSNLTSRADADDEKTERESEESEFSSQNGDSRSKQSNAKNISSAPSILSEAAFHMAEQLAQDIMSGGMAQSLEILKGENFSAIDDSEHKVEGQEIKSKDSLFDALSGFAEDLSSLTVGGAVKIAEAQLGMQDIKSRVRPVATGNWGCGVFRGDPELKAVIQWVAASAAGCPAIVYHTFSDERMLRLLEFVMCLHSRGWKVSDVIQGVVRFCEFYRKKGDDIVCHQGLLSFLCQTPQTSL